jgi:hypothetical protein
MKPLMIFIVSFIIGFMLTSAFDINRKYDIGDLVRVTSGQYEECTGKVTDHHIITKYHVVGFCKNNYFEGNFKESELAKEI